MKLTKSQIQTYEDNGYLVLPDLFTRDEVDVLIHELTATAAITDERVIKEKAGPAIRMVYGLHDRSGPTGSVGYESLVRSARLLQPALDLLGEPANVFHSKVNLKEAINGEFWQWHQDFGNWSSEDAVAAPHMVTSLVLLDQATEVGGCLYFIPGSHKGGLLPPKLDQRTSVKLWTVSKDQMIEAVEKFGEPVAVTGGPGTVVMFHPYLLHGSGQNMSTHERKQFYCVYNAVSNKLGPVAAPRPEYKASRRSSAVQMSNQDVIVGASVLESA
jgi:ectoine hydroxylase